MATDLLQAATLHLQGMVPHLQATTLHLQGIVLRQAMTLHLQEIIALILRMIMPMVVSRAKIVLTMKTQVIPLTTRPMITGVPVVQACQIHEEIRM